MSTSSQVIDKVKRKTPGRPRLRPNSPPIQVFGLTTTPSNPEYSVEMDYQSPSVFKKLSSVLHSIAAAEIIPMNFKESEVNITTHDHLNKSTLYFNIFCSQIIRYYCSTDTEILFKRSRFEEVCKKFSNNCSSVTFLLKEHISNTLYVKTPIVCGNINTSSNQPIFLLDPKREVMAPFTRDDSDDSYPLKFILPVKMLKNFLAVKSVNNAGCCFSVEKYGNEDIKLILKYQRHILDEQQLNSDGKELIRSTLQDDEIFSASVHSCIITAFISAALDENIIISCDMTKRMMFAYKTKTFEARFFTDLVNISSSTPGTEK